MHLRKLLLYIIVLSLVYFGLIHAQEASTPNSWTVSYIENKLSTPDRKVKLEGVSGLLNSAITIEKITISDKKGTWLVGQKLNLVWDRTKLFTGTLAIDSLNIKSINILRKAHHDNSALSQLLSVTNINLKNLPVNILINQLNIDHIYYAKEVYGVEEHLKANGFFIFNNYKLDSILHIDGIDKKNRAYLNIHYNNNKLKLNFDIAEQNDGLLSAILQLKEHQPIHLAIKGGGPLNNLHLNLISNIGNMRALYGYFDINKANLLSNPADRSLNEAENINFRLEGPVRYIVPQAYKSLFSNYSSLSVNAIIMPDHTVEINDCTIEGSALQAHSVATILPDGFLRKLFVKARFRTATEPIFGKLDIKYGYGNNNDWNADLKLHNKQKKLNANIKLFGQAENLNNPNTRHVSMNIDGLVKQSTGPIGITAKLDFKSLTTILIKQLNINSLRNNISISGSAEDKIFNGFTSLNIKDLHELGNIFNKNYYGQIQLSGPTKISPNSIEQALTGTIKELQLDNKYSYITNLFQSPTNIKGKISYNTNQTKLLNFDNFTLINQHLDIKAQGPIGYNTANLTININKLNLNKINPHIKTIVKGIIVSKGHNNIIISAADLTAPNLIINEQNFAHPNIKASIITNTNNIADYTGFIDLNTAQNNLRLEIGDKYNLKFNAQNIPLSLLQPFTKIKLPKVNLTINGATKNNLLNFNIKTAQPNLLLNAIGTYNLHTKYLKANSSGKISSIFFNNWLATKQMEASGLINFNLSANGPVNLPNICGNLYVNNGKFYDLKHDIKLINANIFGKINNNIIEFNQSTARAPNGGTIAAQGIINFQDFKQPNTNIKFNLNNISYNRGIGFNALYSGQLNLKGPLLNNPKLSGIITLTQAQILLSRNLNSATPLEVHHVNTTKPILNTLKRAHMQTIQTAPKKINNILFDVKITAPNKLYVKGNGLDVEMQGNVHVTGPSNNLHSLGSFKMINGHLNLLSHYFDFNRGEITLNGDLKPFLSFEAHTTTDNLTVNVKLEGNIDNIKITFSSNNGLPQDEILAQLLFHRSVKQLSAFQLAKIITTLSNLSGRNNFFNSIQSVSSLENIDIDTDIDGNIGISAGRYITKNLYTSFGATQKGTTKASINWSLPHNFKVTGEYHSNNQNNIGVFYNHDY